MRARFGPFTLDLETRRLYRDADPVHLTPKAWQLLVELVNAAPRAMSKTDLFTALWGDTFVEEANLTVLVAEIRAALDDPARTPRFVKTRNGAAELDEKALARARRLAGLKGYVTNIPATLMPAGEVIGSYHDLWHVEQSFRMSKTDLRARPIFARTRHAIEAHLTIVFTALAVSREAQNRTGLSLRRVLRTLKPLRSATVEINGVITTIPPALKDRMEIISLSGYTMNEKLAIARGFLVPRQLESHGLENNAFMKQNVVGHLLTSDESSSYAGGKPQSLAVIEVKVPSLAFREHGVQQRFVEAVTNIVDDLKAGNHPKSRTFVNVTHAVDGAWGIAGVAYTNEALGAALAAASAAPAI